MNEKIRNYYKGAASQQSGLSLFVTFNILSTGAVDNNNKATQEKASLSCFYY